MLLFQLFLTYNAFQFLLTESSYSFYMDSTWNWSQYLILLIFTGLRRQEAATLKWNQIDFKQKTLTIVDTKNHDSHTLPLSDYLYDLLTQRKNIATTEYVFPSSGAGGYIVEPRKQMEKVIQSSGIPFIIHDLRRTFITIAEGLDISAYAVKRLANHKMKQDITSGYIITDVERLRKPMQQITDYLLKCMGMKKSVDVFEIKQHRKGNYYKILNEG